ncbi:unnamed protein product [Polarella glacialis]|uniref:ABC transporter domain-containing protein n=1 Tax=Polarella glacialis TaxID=89957 RepID=A0A813JSA4_POLGL|nr:unnamed protein product [Polarella glacialis]CAE8688331.1 unnamed protein product [Polarella glacialis]
MPVCGASEMATLPLGLHAESGTAPAANQLAEYQEPWMNAPPAPSLWAVFKVMMEKHIYIARKRRRILTSVWPALMYCGLTVFLYQAVFSSIDDTQMKAYLLALIVPLYVTIAIQGALQCVIVEVVSEKESKMKVIQNIYGLSTSMYWASWMGYFLILSSICVAVIYALLVYAAPIMYNSSPVLVVIILSVSYIQQLLFAAIVSVFFDKQQTASTITSFLNLAMLALVATMQGALRGKSKMIWYLVGLLPTVNVYNGVASVMWLEALYYCDDSGVCSHGLSMRTLHAESLCPVSYSPQKPCPAPVPIFSAAESILLMLVDVVLYGFLAWWLEQVVQGEFGQAKPWTFCIDPAFMCKHRRGGIRSGSSGVARTRLLNSEAAPGRSVVLSMQKLRKAFGSKVAVDDMDLEVYGAEIFALLGHNGAGKTTCMNCVVGLIPMTSGQAVVNGYDIRTDMELARRQMSICPQDNPMYDVFTVRQHLVFFASLRGVNPELVTQRLLEVLTALGMPEKVDDLCTSLSGGQKRRLWVATALLAETPLVFLDEPTSGMDPSSRRELWNILLRMKAAGRCVLFTTHYLEEADVLADRKAVLARGRVQACGTSRDLKLQFGLGYHLQIELSAGYAPEHLQRLSSMVHRHVTGAQQEEGSCGSSKHTSHTGGVLSGQGTTVEVQTTTQVQFTLPFHEVTNFGPLFLELDSEKDMLHVKHYSVSMTSLEEVFMSLGQRAERQAVLAGEAGHSVENADFRVVSTETQSEPHRAESSDRRAAQAMMKVRLLQLFGNRRALWSAVVCPAIFNIAFLAIQGAGGKQNSSDGNLGLAIYPPLAFGVSIIAFTMQLVQDKEWKCKYVSLAHGLSVKSYWAGTFVAHYIVSLLNSLILAVAIAVDPNTGGLSRNSLALIFVEAVIYPVGLLLLAYNASLLFSKVEMAVKVMPLSSLFLGTVPTVCVALFLALPDQYPDIARKIHFAMSILNPVYSLPGTLVMISSEPELTPLGYFTSWCAVPLYCSVLSWALFGTNLLWQDARSYSAKPGNFQEFGNERKDEDVLAEELRVSSSLTPSEDEAACYQGLSHTYRTKVDRKWKETHAVRGISLGIRSGECFGLLGPNGAGKTTTLAVLTGEVRPPSAGKVTLHGHDVTSAAGLAAAYKLLGLCPQTDPLWETVTGRQHLLFYGRVKGVPEAQLGSTVDRLLYRLGLEDSDAKKAASTYSGGMKRKLSLAIALIGNSPLLFLDEPSAAVDAGAKRHLWKVINMRQPGQTVALTTHSMEEAEALCDRIAIQVRGQLRCLGTPGHIKNKYGSGYQVELFCHDLGESFGEHALQDAHIRTKQLENFVHTRLSPDATLLEHHAGRFLFQLPPLQNKLTLGKVFCELQSNMSSLGITDYSLMQPSLEQVFVRFAREQEEIQEGETPNTGNAVPVITPLQVGRASSSDA